MVPPLYYRKHSTLRGISPTSI